jgi:hypothetical protein
MNHRYLKYLVPVFAGALLGILASSVFGIQLGSDTETKTENQVESQTLTEDSPYLLFDPRQNPSQVVGLQFQIQQLTSQLRMCQADTSMLRLQELQNQMNTNRN